MIQEREYAELANAVNHSVRWVSLSFESICLALLYVFIPAHAPHFLVSRRRLALLVRFVAYSMSCSAVAPKSSCSNAAEFFGAL